MFKLLLYLLAGTGFLLMHTAFLDLGSSNGLDKFDTELFEYGFALVLGVAGVGLIILGFLDYLGYSL